MSYYLPGKIENATKLAKQINEAGFSAVSFPISQYPLVKQMPLADNIVFHSWDTSGYYSHPSLPEIAKTYDQDPLLKTILIPFISKFYL